MPVTVLHAYPWIGTLLFIAGIGIGYLVAHHRYKRIIADALYPSTAKIGHVQAKAADALLDVIRSLENENRGQPLSISRIERRFSRHFEELLRVPKGTFDCVITISLQEQNYHVEIKRADTTGEVLQIVIPAEWVRTGIDDVRLDTPV